jgi:hypothetical protein
LPDLLNRVWNKLLSPKPRVHTHNQHVVYYAQHIIQLSDRCCWIDDYPHQCAFLMNQLERSMEVPAGFGVHAHRSRASLNKYRGEKIGIFDHQMVVELKACDASNAFRHRWAKRQIRHEMPIHDVHMEHLDTRRFHGFDLLAEARKVGGKNGWKNLDHAFVLPESRACRGTLPRLEPS